jgi:D-glycero-alpha-D-manno-heptose-7-phosphate kinase
VVRELIKYLEIKPGLEIHYYGDLPARSGMGSSSCFTVGLMQSLYGIKKINLNKLDLAKKSIYFEQNIMKEVVGSQDQISATYGGFNKIVFKTGGGFNVLPFSLKKKKIQKLNKNLLLVYSGLTRTAHHIAKSYVHKLQTSKKSHILEISSFVKEGERILKEGKLDDFGKLLHESWLEKKSLSPLIANSHINEIYDLALKKGALGGKLLGAGGGGFLVFYVPHHKQKNFIRHFKNLINVPFKFTSEGSNIMFNNFNN